MIKIKKQFLRYIRYALKSMTCVNQLFKLQPYHLDDIHIFYLINYY
jgi:hypothetical protein